MGEFNSRMNALGTGLGIGKKKAAPAPQAHHQNDMIEGATTELGRAAGALFVSVTMQGGEGQSITNTLSYLLHVMSVPHTSSVAVSEGLHSTTLTKEDTMRPFVVTLDTCQGMVANSSLHDSLERLQSASQEDHEEVVTFLGILGVVASRKDPLTALACINRAKEIVLTDAAELPAEHIDLVTKEAVVLNVLKLHERAHDVSYEGFSRLLADGEEVYAMYGVVDMGLQLAFALFNMQRSEEALKVLTRVSGVKRIPLVIRNSYNILREAVEADVARHVDPLLPLPQASQLWVTYSALRRIPEVSALSLNHAPETTLKVLAQSFEALLAGKEGGEGGGGGEEGEGEGEGAQSESEALVTPVLRNIGSVVVYVDQGEGLESMQEGNVRVCICDNAEVSFFYFCFGVWPGVNRGEPILGKFPAGDAFFRCFFVWFYGVADFRCFRAYKTPPFFFFWNTNLLDFVFCILMYFSTLAQSLKFSDFRESLPR